MNDIKKRTPIADYDNQYGIHTDDDDEGSESEVIRLISDAKIPSLNSVSESDKELRPIPNAQPIQYWQFGFGVLVLLIILPTIFHKLNGYSLVENSSQQDASIELLNYFQNEQRFPSQDENLWFDVAGALQIIPKKPSVFLLLHNNDNTTSVCIAELITRAVNKFLFKGNKKWILLNGSSISRKLKDHGEIVKQVKDKIQSHHILVVNDLQDISSNLIKAFHFILDYENPIVEKAVYILIINVNNKSIKKNAAETATKTMMKLWNDLHVDVLYPLITRITLTTLAIAKEENIQECLLYTKNTLILNDYLNPT